MKLISLLLVVPIVAAFETPNVLGTIDEETLVLADLDDRNRVQPSYCYGPKNFNCYRNGYPKCCSQTKGNCPVNSKPGCEGYRNQPGNSYCTYAPDFTCYQSGWPQCCNASNNLQCPTYQPICDKGAPGYNYCTQAPNYKCYRSGRPACCGNNGGVNCPKTKPACNTDDGINSDAVTDDEEIDENTIVDNAVETTDISPNDVFEKAGPVVLADLDDRNRVQPSYCYGPKNFNCYRNGYPKCCSQTKGNCPVNSKPGCEGYRNQPGNSYCTYAPDFTCYQSGWPKCCNSSNNLQCPTYQPICDQGAPGYNYCTQAPNYKCYRNGRPACCGNNGGVNCPKTKPACNTEDGIDELNV